MDKDYKELLEVIKIKRKEQGISQEKMAEKLGLAKLTYQRYENGINPMPMNIFMKAAKVLGVDLLVNKPEQKETSLITFKETDINDLVTKKDLDETKKDINDKLDELLKLFKKKK